MFLRSIFVFGVILGSTQMAAARCASISDSATTDRLLEQVRPEIEYTSTGIYPYDRLVEQSGPHAEYDPDAGIYHHTLENELKLYDVSFQDCGARYRVSFKPSEKPLRSSNTFVFNKVTGWLIETESDESRFKVYTNEELFEH
jgi:hypothetical protein